jgi:predicted DNA-binding protein (MmcQ/YjbR family)
MAKKKVRRRRAPLHGRPQSRKPVARRSGVNCARLHEFCRGLAGATLDVKWGDNLIWSVGEKMFAGFQEGEDGKPSLPFGFKCSDDEFDRLTQMAGIIPAPYAARFGWVSVREPSALSQKEAEGLVAESYRLVVEKLPRKVREGIGTGPGKKAKR